VLIVDDDGAFRRTAGRVLRGRGYEVVGEAETMAQARAAIVRLRPDAILLDVHLPDGSGTALAGELVAGGFETRVLLTSSDAAIAPTGMAFVAKTDLIAADLSRYLG
jgi:response regulator of citrate/malate metabolism